MDVDMGVDVEGVTNQLRAIDCPVGNSLLLPEPGASVIIQDAWAPSQAIGSTWGILFL